MVLLVLAIAIVVGEYKIELEAIGYCDAGSQSNSYLVDQELERSAVEACHAEHVGSPAVQACPPLPLLPLPHPTVCTPCPAHGKCTRTEVICDEGFVLKPHPLSIIPLVTRIANGLPGLGPVAFPPTCVADVIRRRNIGVLGRDIDTLLAEERGNLHCRGIDAKKSLDGGDARRWGFEADALKKRARTSKVY